MTIMTTGTPTRRTSRVRWFGDESSVRPGPEAPTSLHLSGSDPVRVLVLGDGPAVGFTMVSHDFALGGQVAGEIGSRTSRGVGVDIRSDPQMTPHDALQRARRLDLRRYDAVIVTLGTFDAVRMTPPRQWLDDMHELIAYLTSATRPGTRIAMGTIPPFETSRRMSAQARRTDRWYADVLNAALTETVWPPEVTLVPLHEESAAGSEVQELPHTRRRRWAHALVDAVGDLGATPLRADPVPTRRDEHRRQDALRRTGVLEAGPRAEFESIATTLQQALSVPIVALNFIDAAYSYASAARGFEIVPVDREFAFCDHTIRRSRTLLVPDAAVDDRFAANPFVTGPGGLRCYAGQPVESPDGERIGALCVMDDKPRDFAAQEVTVLQELAFRAQKVLYTLPR